MHRDSALVSPCASLRLDVRHSLVLPF
jgi:hypothetical protein